MFQTLTNPFRIYLETMRTTNLFSKIKIKRKKADA